MVPSYQSSPPKLSYYHVCMMSSSKRQQTTYLQVHPTNPCSIIQISAEDRATNLMCRGLIESKIVRSKAHKGISVISPKRWFFCPEGRNHRSLESEQRKPRVLETPTSTAKNKKAKDKKKNTRAAHPVSFSLWQVPSEDLLHELHLGVARHLEHARR